MDINLLEQLLNESESAYLDFKQEQYKFSGANDSTKSELLKDILAFTNAWRRTDAFILIGVEEIKGGRSNVIGVNAHLDDHSLQQFVTSKTQEPITFSYIPFDYLGKQIGIIQIPIQKRPIYLRKSYGGLEKNVVYIRRGSSTDTANPDEIARMGTASLNELNQLSIDLQFADVDSRKTLGRQINLISTVLEIQNVDKIPDFDPPRKLSGVTAFMGEPKKNYYRELVNYYAVNLLVKPIGFSIKNIGQTTAQNIRMLVTNNQDTEINILTGSDLPSVPIQYSYPFHSVSQKYIESPYSNLDLSFYGTEWTLEINFGNVQPKATAWVDEVIYIGAREERTLMLNCQIFADNLPNPITAPLTISFSIEDLQADISTIEKWIEKEEEERARKIEELLDDEL